MMVTDLFSEGYTLRLPPSHSCGYLLLNGLIRSLFHNASVFSFRKEYHDVFFPENIYAFSSFLRSFF